MTKSFGLIPSQKKFLYKIWWNAWNADCTNEKIKWKCLKITNNHLENYEKITLARNRIHEIAHVLGFIKSHYSNWIDSNGSRY